MFFHRDHVYQCLDDVHQEQAPDCFSIEENYKRGKCSWCNLTSKVIVFSAGSDCGAGLKEEQEQRGTQRTENRAVRCRWVTSHHITRRWHTNVEARLCWDSHSFCLNQVVSGQSSTSIKLCKQLLQHFYSGNDSLISWYESSVHL